MRFAARFSSQLCWLAAINPWPIVDTFNDVLLIARPTLRAGRDTVLLDSLNLCLCLCRLWPLRLNKG